MLMISTKNYYYLKNLLLLKMINVYIHIIKKLKSHFLQLFQKIKLIHLIIKNNFLIIILLIQKKKLKSIVKRNESKLNIYNTIIPWIPPKYIGNYFEDFKRLPDHYDMSNWEKVFNKIYIIFNFQHRIHLCERSYQKEKLLPLKKDFTCKKLRNYELNKFPNSKDNLTEAIQKLSPSGKKLIKIFINENDKIEKKKRDDEEKLYIYKHSKPPIQYNSWKFSNHIIEEFSRPKADEIYGFRKKIKTKYQYNAEPFRRRKEKGDYFDKNIGIL